MRRYLLRRLAQAAAVVALVSALTFVLLHLAPGDPFSATLNDPNATEAQRAMLRSQYGLDQPLGTQFARYVGGVARGEFGYSFYQHQPVRDAILAAMPNTLLLMSVAIALSFAVGIAIGVMQALHAGSGVDRWLGALSLFFYSMPDFWLALMAMLAFAYWIPIFPATGMVDAAMHEYLSPLGRLGDRLHHLALPAITLTLLSAASVARFQRAAMLDVMHEDYVRTARAKGTGRGAVVFRHVLRNALLPTISLLGLSFPALLGGTVFIERVFAWPGMGMLAVSAIGARDYFLVVACVIVGSTMVAIGSLVADVLYAVADPRLRGR